MEKSIAMQAKKKTLELIEEVNELRTSLQEARQRIEYYQASGMPVPKLGQRVLLDRTDAGIIAQGTAAEADGWQMVGEPEKWWRVTMERKDGAK
jgi:hypothetical protein